MTRIGKSARQKPGRNRRRSKEPPGSLRGQAFQPEEGSLPAGGVSVDTGSGPDRFADGGINEEHDDEYGDLDDLEFDPNARDILGDFGLDDEEAVPEESDFWFERDDDLED